MEKSPISASGAIGTSYEVVLPGLVEPADLIRRETYTELPAPGHVTLLMEATGISFAEQQMRRGKYYDQPPFPFVPGYDLVGIVQQTGHGVDPAIIGRRFAAITKTGAWATQVAVAVNGVTAWQMLYQYASVPAAGTIVVHGANGGVGSVLVQLARNSGMRVIGTASSKYHEQLRALGVEPVDYRDLKATEQIRQLIPDGADAVFDHLGGASLIRSRALLRRGGKLIAYGTAASKNDPGNSRLPVLKDIARLVWWNILPDGKKARFYNFWAGRRRVQRFQTRQREAFSEVIALLEQGLLKPRIAGRFPLSDVVAAFEFAESGVSGKVILLGKTADNA